MNSEIGQLKRVKKLVKDHASKQNKPVILGLRQNAAPVPGIIVRCATTQSVALVRPHAYIRHYSRATCRKSTAFANIVSNG